MGVEKCLLKAKDCLFWPGISKDIKEMTANCETCLQYAKKQQAEPLLQHSLPSFPWQKLGSDLFDYKGVQYLLVADYYSKFPIVRKLNSTTSSAVINHLKSVFAEYGIPETIITDNGPQYSSQEFQTFCNVWGINHITSSPLYPQSNRFSERMVQTVNNLLKKSDASGQDPYLGLLMYRTTPVDSKLPAPAELLNYRAYRTQIPSSGRLQRSQSSEIDAEHLQHRQQMQRQQHEHKPTRELQELRPGQTVALYRPQSKTWNTGEVKEKCNEPRSYIVETPSGSELRRNRVQLRSTGQPSMQTSFTENPAILPLPTTTLPTPTPASTLTTTPGSTADRDTGPQVTTRSGRTVKAPQKLDL